MPLRSFKFDQFSNQPDMTLNTIHVILGTFRKSMQCVFSISKQTGFQPFTDLAAPKERRDDEYTECSLKEHTKVRSPAKQQHVWQRNHD